MDNKKIGLFLQNLRKQKNLTQLELATCLNVTHQSVSKWENGDSVPDISTLEALAIFYQVSIDEIIKGEYKTTEYKRDQSIDEIKPIDKIWIISKLACVTMVFASLFFYYISETIKIGNLNPFEDWNPFGINEMESIVHYKGFNCIFNATGLSFITAGAWMIFLSLLVLIVIFSLVLTSAVTKNNYYHYIKENHYLKLKKFLVLIMISGYIIFTLGINESVRLGMGYYIGLFLSLVVLIIDKMENRKEKY